nr:MAG TPA: hypothetical protein [Caudoviricetes sp.]
MIEIFECRFITLYCSNDIEPVVEAEVAETYREFRALLVAVSDGREGYASVFRTLSDLHALLQMLTFRFRAGIKKKASIGFLSPTCRSQYGSRTRFAREEAHESGTIPRPSFGASLQTAPVENLHAIQSDGAHFVFGCSKRFCL